MNRGKWIILGGVAALVVATLYPPWIVTIMSADLRPIGEETRYAFLLPPSILWRFCEGPSSVYWGLLLVEWGTVFVVTGVLYFVFRQGKDRAPVSTEK